MVEPKAPQCPALLVGVGGLGCRIAAQCRNDSVRRRLVDFDEAALAAYRPAETLHLLGEPDQADPVAAQLAEQAVAETLDHLAEAIEGEPVVILIGAVGRDTGALVLPALAHEFKGARCPTLVVALEPLPFEGAPRVETAARTMDDLAHVADLVLPVPNRQLDEVCDTSLPIHQALAQLTEKTRDAIGHLLDALADPSCIGLQLEELRHALLDAGRGAFGVGGGRGERRVEIALRDICANSFLNPESCQRASAAILHLRGGKDLSLQEINGATGLVAHLVGDVAIEACLSTDEHAGDAVQALLLITGVQPPHSEVANGEAAAAPEPHQNLSYYDGVNLDVPAYLRRRSSYRVKR